MREGGHIIGPLLSSTVRKGFPTSGGTSVPNRKSSGKSYLLPAYKRRLKHTARWVFYGTAIALRRLFTSKFSTEERVMNAVKSPMASDHEVLTIKEICDVLQVHPSTVYRLVRQRKIPSFRIGTDWRFRRDVIERWMTEESMGSPH
jgi:excisionase family DNA binding protein